MLHKSALVILLGTLLLTGCNMPTGPISVTPTGDPISTEVSQLLTAMPTATSRPTDTAAPPTAAPSDTPAPVEASPTPTQPAAAATAAATATRDPDSSLGNPTWRETFDSGKAFYQYESDNTKVLMRNGALELTGLTANGWHGWSLTYSQKPRNFVLEGEFNTQTCSGADIYGLVFRAPNTDAGYFFGVTCDGRYSLHARNFANGEDSALVNLTTNSAIRTGSNQSNRIWVRVEGEKISMYANDVLLQEVNNNKYLNEGNVGAFVAANETAGFTVLLDTVSLWVLP